MIRPVRVRVAPSPTGDPHVGTAYIALFNYVFSRSQGGQFVLRIEDTDRVRSRPDSERAIFEALRWLGLSWDEGPDVGGPHGPYRQSERNDIYLEYARNLIAAGRAYPCFCTAQRLDQLREQQRESKGQIGYDRRCRDLDRGAAAARVAAGEPHTVRLAVPNVDMIAFEDRLRGRVEISTQQVDEQVLVKTDGFPTYHLANVVDDHLMQISHVIRAEEWISSTPKHVLLYDALGWQPPEWIHMPLLRNENKSKLSKRKNAVSINYYRDAGILPGALLNFLGIMGWSFGGDREIFSLKEMIEAFSWDRVSLGGPVFNSEKLRWMNEKYIHQLSHEQLVDELLRWRLSRDYLLRVVPLMRERIKQLNEFVPSAEYFFSGDVDCSRVADQLSIPDVKPKDIRAALIELIETFDALPSFAAAALEAATREFAEARGWKSKHLFMLLRVGVTGRSASPPLFEVIEVIGKELTRHRLRELAAHVGSATEAK